MVKAPCFLLPLVLLLVATKADPDLIVDFCVPATGAAASARSSSSFNGIPCIDPAEARGSHFATSLLSTPGVTTANRYGFAAAMTNVSSWPGCNGQGLTLARADVAPGGLVPPHTHPRSSEAVVVIAGELVAGFVDTANRYFAARLRPMEAFMIPRGMLHFQYNPNPSVPALAIAVFGSQNPGVHLTVAAFLSTPPVEVEVLEKAYGISQQEAERIRKNLGG